MPGPARCPPVPIPPPRQRCGLRAARRPRPPPRGTRPPRLAYDNTQKGTRVLISLWDSLMFGRVPGTRPNISESHSEISTRVPFCIEGGGLPSPAIARVSESALVFCIHPRKPCRRRVGNRERRRAHKHSVFCEQHADWGVQNTRGCCFVSSAGVSKAPPPAGFFGRKRNSPGGLHGVVGGRQGDGGSDGLHQHQH